MLSGRSEALLITGESLLDSRSPRWQREGGLTGGQGAVDSYGRQEMTQLPAFAGGALQETG